MRHYLNPLIPILFLLLAIIACSPQQEDKAEARAADLIGKWEAKITVSNEESLPFRFEVMDKGNGSLALYLINAEERIEVEDIEMTADSVFLGMHIFNTAIEAAIAGNELSGLWVKKDYEDYRLPFSAVRVQEFAKPSGSTQMPNITGKWEVAFEGENGEDEPAVGIFKQEGALLTGTFLTPTGDYRYLSGFADSGKIQLSCFDGEHAFLFRADIAEDGEGLENGHFWSGKSWHQGWTARKDADASLPDPSSLTFLKEGYEKIEFSFPNLDGEMVSLSDEKYRGKVVIVQLMGSWCPNCMDETAFLSPYYNENRNEGLEIVGLAFERDPALDKAGPRLEKLINRFDIKYDLLVAGSNSKSEAGEKLPMLNHVLSFPTTIFIDRKGRVRKIHTGFSGPGTGIYYEDFVEEFKQLMDKLLAEEA